MRIAITDANVFIDLFEIGWIEKLFYLKLEIVTTLEVFNELNPLQQQSLLQWQGSGQLRVVEVLLSEHPQVLQIGDSRRLSFSDRTVLFIALRDNLMVLTGDNIIRKNAKKLGLEVHGMLWVFDTLVASQTVQASEAAVALQLLLRVNDWLPIEECYKRIEKWQT
jgi:predicted nucleic acid-binding protein